MIICDNSLCNMDISEKATRKAVQDYILALFESGIDIVEIDNKSIRFLEGVNTSNRFIYRAEGLVDLLTATEKAFAYVSISYDMFYFARKFREVWLKKKKELNGDKIKGEETLQGINYLVEVNGDGKSTYELLNICRNLIETECVSAIRIAKNFDPDSNELSDLIDRYYDEFNTPLDICPLNTNLNGITAAYEAFGKEVNMLTLSFGSPYLYTPYELFVLYFPPTLGLSPAMVFTTYLYITAARYNAVSDSMNCGLRNMNNVIDCSKKGIVNIDTAKKEAVPRRYAAPKPKIETTFTKIQKDFCDSNGIDSEIGKELSEALENFDMSLYNRFFIKGDFEN